MNPLVFQSDFGLVDGAVSHVRRGVFRESRTEDARPDP